MIRIGPRRGDAAPMAIVELVDRPVIVDEEETKKKSLGDRLLRRNK